MSKFAIYLFIIVGFALPATGQEWVRLMESPDATLSQIQEAAEVYFAEQGTGRGTGYKQYKRWEYRQELKRDAAGRRKDYRQIRAEYENWQQNLPAKLQSTAGDYPWTEMGPITWDPTSAWNPGVGRVTGIAAAPSNQQVLYITSPGGGCWKSNDAGQSWVPLTDNLTFLTLYSVAVNPNDENIVYVGSGDGQIQKSNDGGATWNSVSFGLPATRIYSILVNPDDTDILFAGSPSGVYRTENGGTSWTQVVSADAEDVVFKPGDTDIVYTASATSFYKSTDGGQTFSAISGGLSGDGRSRIAVTPANPEYVYLVRGSSDSGYYGFFQSTNSGDSFSARNTYNGSNNYFGYSISGGDAGGQSWYDMGIAASPTDANEVYIAGIVVWKTTNGGSTFSPQTEWFYPNATGYNHADVHVLRYEGTTLYSGSDGGIYKRDESRASGWQDLSQGLGIRQFYRLGTSELNSDRVVAGAQDNGTSVKQAGSSWVDWLGADGMEGFIDHSNPAVIYGTSQFGSLYKSNNGGASYFGLPSPDGRGNWITPWAQHSQNAETLYLGYDEVYRSTNGGFDWAAISNFRRGNLREIEVAPSDGDHIYVSHGTSLFYTADAGQNWQDVYHNSGWSGGIADIAIDPENPELVTVALRQSSSQVWQSADAGQTWRKMVNGLPSLDATTIASKPGGENALYLGMEVGVYYYDDILAEWIPFLEDLPKVEISELEVTMSAGKIRVATYGRGLWEAPLYEATILAPSASFVVSTGNGIPGEEVSFSDGTINHPSSWLWEITGSTTYTSSAQNPVIQFLDPGTFDVKLTVSNSAGSDSVEGIEAITIARNDAYCHARGNDQVGVYISNVQSQSLNNASGNTFLADYRALESIEYRAGQSYWMYVTLENVNTAGADVTVYADWNGDQVFDVPTESTKLTFDQGSKVASGLILVPASTVPGNTLMRVRVTPAGTLNLACDISRGEVEDYQLSILAADNQQNEISQATAEVRGQYLWLSWTMDSVPAGFFEVYSRENGEVTWELVDRQSVSVDETDRQYDFSYRVEEVQKNSTDWRLVLADAAGGIIAWKDFTNANETPTEYKLDTAYPNPFNDQTTISWYMNGNAEATLSLYDVNGQRVRELLSDYLLVGNHSYVLSADGLAAGVYFCQLSSRLGTVTSRIVVVK